MYLINHISSKSCKYIDSIKEKVYKSVNWYHMNYNYVDISRGIVQPLPSDLDWHLSYWEAQLPKYISERLKIGIHNWSELPKNHDESLKLISKNIFKFDIVIESKKNIYEIMSIASIHKPSEIDCKTALKALHHISYIANKNRDLYMDDCFLEIGRLCGTTTKSKKPIKYKKIKYNFNGITLTQLDIDLLSEKIKWKTNKEIANSFQVSTNYIDQKINILKTKLGCQSMPLSKLYEITKDTGILELCN